MQIAPFLILLKWLLYFLKILLGTAWLHHYETHLDVLNKRTIIIMETSTRLGLSYLHFREPQNPLCFMTDAFCKTRIHRAIRTLRGSKGEKQSIREYKRLLIFMTLFMLLWHQNGGFVNKVKFNLKIHTIFLISEEWDIIWKNSKCPLPLRLGKHTPSHSCS